MADDTARLRLAWLIWCYGEGYTKAEDRATMNNWMGDDASTLIQEDIDVRDALLEIADEILAALGSTDG